MAKYSSILFLIFGLSLKLLAQDSLFIPNHKSFKESSLLFGYSYFPENSETKKLHFLEFRYQKAIYGGYHPVLASWTAGTDISINTDDLIFGPRIGGIFGFGMFFLGSDIACYTNFHRFSPQIIPSLGFGYHQFRISMNPHIRIVNRDYEPISPIHLNIVVKFYSIKKEEVE